MGEKPFSFDNIILNGPHHALLIPTCAKELFVLRRIGLNWHELVKQVREAQKEMLALPNGFGGVEYKLYVTRKIQDGNVVQVAGQSIDLTKELFEWPLRK
jgi:hypothetical protein